MLINPPTPSVAIKLTEGHAYHGPYRIDVTHLAKDALKHLIMFIVFTAAFIPLLLGGASQWVVWLIGVIAAEALMNLTIRLWQLVRKSVNER